jgi:hypothetical protein
MDTLTKFKAALDGIDADGYAAHLGAIDAEVAEIEAAEAKAVAEIQEIGREIGARRAGKYDDEAIADALLDAEDLAVAISVDQLQARQGALRAGLGELRRRRADLIADGRASTQNALRAEIARAADPLVAELRNRALHAIDDLIGIFADARAIHGASLSAAASELCRGLSSARPMGELERMALTMRRVDLHKEKPTPALADALRARSDIIARAGGHGPRR